MSCLSTSQETVKTHYFGISYEPLTRESNVYFNFVTHNHQFTFGCGDVDSSFSCFSLLGECKVYFTNRSHYLIKLYKFAFLSF